MNEAETIAEGLLAYLRTQAQGGVLDLAWLEANPTWAGDVMTVLYFLATFGGYLVSIFYFFYSRGRPRSSS